MHKVLSLFDPQGVTAVSNAYRTANRKVAAKAIVAVRDAETVVALNTLLTLVIIALLSGAAWMLAT
jgi:hypothetical protein